MHHSRPGTPPPSTWGLFALTTTACLLTLALGTGQHIQAQEVQTLVQRSQGPIFGVRFSPDGAHLVSGGQNGTVAVWDLQSRRQVQVIEAHTSTVTMVTTMTTPQGALRIVTGGRDGAARVWDPSQPPSSHGKHRPLTTLGGPLVAASAALGTVVSGDRFALGWDALFDQPSTSVRDWLTVHPAHMRDERMSAIACADRVARCAVVSSGVQLQVVDLQGPHRAKLPLSPKSWINALALSPDGTVLATAESSDTVVLRDATSKDLPPRQTLKVPQGDIRTLTFSPSGQLLAIAADKGPVSLWEVTSGALIRPLTDLGHDAGCVPLSLDFSPNNERLAAGCSDGVRLVSVATGLQTQHLRGTAEPVRSASLSPDGRWMASLSNTTIAVWDMQALRLRHTLDLGPLRGLRYTPTGHLMTLGEETIDLRSDRTGKVIRSFRRPKKWSHPPSFSPDGQRMAVYTPSDQKFGTRTGTVTVWTLDQEGGRPGTRSFRIHMGLGRLVFGPQGQRIAAVMGQGRLDNKAIGIWDIASGRLVKTLRYDASDTFEPKEAYLSDLAWSPDGSVVVASAGAPNQLVVWDPTTGRQLKTLRTGKLKALTFSTDGRRLAATVSASNTREGRVVVWEIPSWTQPASVEGGSPAQFFPDAKRMLTGYRGGLRLWTLEETTPQSLHLRSRGRSRANCSRPNPRS
ncbi:MAG: WD40 repeat domain-containing protein, partial [Myxococcota bacterium]